MMQSPSVDAPPRPTAPAAPTAITVKPSQLGSPSAVYHAMREKRSVLSDQMGRLLDRRERVVKQLDEVGLDPAAKTALQQHLQELNGRVIDMEKQLHASDAEVAAAAGVPGARAPEPRAPSSGPNDDVALAGTVFGGIALVIVALAYARRLWRGVPNVTMQIPAAFEARFTRFEQAVDAMAIEIERVSEGQRFLTRVMSEPAARVGAGEAPAEPVRRA